ncbi:hypothetical protein D3C80_1817210 [compost metagenome]
MQRPIEPFGESAPAAFVELVDVALGDLALAVLNDRGDGNGESATGMGLGAVIDAVSRLSGHWHGAPPFMAHRLRSIIETRHDDVSGVVVAISAGMVVDRLGEGETIVVAFRPISHEAAAI